MKKIFILFLLCIYSVYPQHFEGTSRKTSISIVNLPPDQTPPSVTFTNLRQVEEGYPIQQRNRELILSGKITDLTGGSRILANNNGKDFLFRLTDPKAFNIVIPLYPGINNIKLRIYDRKKNFEEKELVVNQDNNADTTAPFISVMEPAPFRGENIFKKDSVIKIKINAKDNTGLMGVYANNQRLFETDYIFEYIFDSNKNDTVVVKAVDSAGNLSFAKLSFVSPTAVIASQNKGIKYHGVIIAVENYKDTTIVPLSAPFKDGKNLVKVLTSNYLFDTANIQFVKNPTRSALFKVFYDLSRKLNENDNLLIFYAGHGIYDSVRKQGYWLPSDADMNVPSEWISNSDIRDLINGIRTKHTLLIADACFSGGIFQTTRSLDQGRPVDEIFEDAEISELETYKRNSRKAITSGELAIVPDKSIFMEYLIKYLNDNTQKRLTAQKLFMNLKDPVINNSPIKQIPQYGVINGTGDLGGDFIFIKK